MAEFKVLTAEELNALDVDQIIEVHPAGKYFIVVPEGINDDQLNEIRRMLDEWLESTYPFMLVTNDIVIARIDDEGK